MTIGVCKPTPISQNALASDGFSRHVTEVSILEGQWVGSSIGLSVLLTEFKMDKNKSRSSSDRGHPQF